MKKRSQFVRVSELNMLRQMRQTITGIEDLAESIASKTLIQEPCVAVLDDAEALTYLQTLNRLWGCDYRVADLVRSADGQFRILFAGHRRLHAIHRLLSHSCRFWDAQQHSLPENREQARFRRNLKRGILSVSVHYSISVHCALDIQFSENTHGAVPILEDAEAHFDLWNLRKHENPDLKLSEFARSVSRPVDQIRRRIRFFDLPEIIRLAVREERIEWGIAQHLATFYNYLPDEKEILDLLDLAIQQKYKVKAFAKYVREKIEAHKVSQKSFEDQWFSAAEKQDFIDRNRNASSGDVLAREFETLVDHLAALRFAHEHGISHGRSPLKAEVAQAAIRNHISALRAFIAYGKSFLPPVLRREARLVCLEAEKTLDLAS